MKNKWAAVFTLILIVISIGLLVYALINRDTAASTVDVSQELAAQSRTAGSVEVSVTPLLTNSSYEFGISLNTHTTEPTYDLSASTTLTNDKGQVSKPLQWEGDGPGGHHRTGKLIFSTFTEKPKSLSLTISNVEGQGLNFEWDI